MAKKKEDNPTNPTFPILEEGGPPEIITGMGKSSDELALEIDAALKQEEPSDKEEPTFKAPEEESSPEEVTTPPDVDTGEDESALKRLMEKKGYKGAEEVAKAYEDLEKLLGKRGDIPSESLDISPTKETVPPPEADDRFWELMASKPKDTIRGIIRETIMEDAQGFNKQFQENTRRRIAFEDVASEKLPYWDDIKGDYNRNIQFGMPFETAFKEADLNYLRGHFRKGYARGLADKDKKQYEAANAEIEGTVASPTRESGEITQDQAEKMPLEDLEKLLPHKYE